MIEFSYPTGSSGASTLADTLTCVVSPASGSIHQIMPWSRIPSPGLQPSSLDPSGRGGPDLVTEILDPVLVPLGFAPGQVGVVGERGQVIFCRGEIDSADDGCVDLVVEVEATPDWLITDVRYWGLPSDRWHLDFDGGAGLADQLALPRSDPSERVGVGSLGPLPGAIYAADGTDLLGQFAALRARVGLLRRSVAARGLKAPRGDHRLGDPAGALTALTWIPLSQESQDP